MSFLQMPFFGFNYGLETPGLTYGRFVAGRSSGTNQRAAWSNDGITWNISTTPNSFSYFGGDFSPDLGLYILVANDSSTSNIISSTNGVTWTARTKPNTNSLFSISWCSTWNKFLATGNTNLYESTDGITWTIAFTHSLTACGLESTFAQTPSGPVFASLIRISGAESVGHTQILYSTDGSSFATYSFLDNGITFRVATDILYDSTLNKWISTSRFETGGVIVQSSTISSGWTNYSEGVLSAPRLSGGSNNLGRFVISNSFGTNTTAGLKYSDTGLSASWTNATMPSGTKDPYDIVYAPEIGTWFSSNFGSTTAFISATGASWSSVTAPSNMLRFVWGAGVRTDGYKQGSGIT
jgi:hypothetical protein